jgi:DNA primase
MALWPHLLEGAALEVDGSRCRSPTRQGRLPRLGVTKIDLIRYYLAVAAGALRGVADRPMILKRFVKGITEEAVFQKRAPEKRPDYVDVAELKYASGTSAKEACSRRRGLVWAVNLGCVDLNPASGPRRPTSPTPTSCASTSTRCRCRLASDHSCRARPPREVLEDHGLTAVAEDVGLSAASTSMPASRDAWPFKFVRLAAQTVAPEVERRDARSRYRAVVERKNREGVFVDFNQNAFDRTGRLGVLGAGHPRREGVTPLLWGRGHRLPPRRLHRRDRCPPRFAERGDPWEGMDDAAGGLDQLLDLADRLGPAEKAPRGARGSGAEKRRVSSKPLIEIARTKTKDEAMAALDTWRTKYEEVAKKLKPADVLLDGMRGPSSIWYRIRINLQHVPEDQRPPQEALLADYNPWENYSGAQFRRPQG